MRIGKNLYIILIILSFVIAVVYLKVFNDSPSQDNMLVWGNREIECSDFTVTTIDTIQHEALITTGIYCPNIINKGNSKVFSFMRTDLSQIKFNAQCTESLIKHERYHFIITEYCTRLLRMNLIDLIKSDYTSDQVIQLHEKFSMLNDSLQDQYDFDTDHNKNLKNQYEWESVMDQFMLNTEKYSESDILKY